MNRPITLWKPQNSVASDDACTTITKYELAPAPPAGPYTDLVSLYSAKGGYVPSLKSLCIKTLLHYPHQVHVIGIARVHYTPPKSPSDYDIIRSLIPWFSHEATDTSFLETVDPRLWAILVQVLSPIPETFQVYTLPLSDPHLPLLQQIPQTPEFSLVTVVELRSCPHLDDKNIHLLGDLHNLSALDIGRCAISSWGVRAFSKTLQRATADSESRGPWGLRILGLDETQVDSTVMEHLICFPLLSIVDLTKNKKCTVTQGHPSGFRPSENDQFYLPAPLGQRLQSLAELCATSDGPLFSHPHPFFLHVNRQNNDSSHALAKSREVRLRCQRMIADAEAASFTQSEDTEMHDVQIDPVEHVPASSPTLGEPREGRLRMSTLIAGANEEPEVPRRMRPLSDIIERANAVAGEEAQIEARRRGVTAFYARLPPPKRQALQLFASSTRHRPQQPLSPKDRKLRLFRPPPPWSFLVTQTCSVTPAAQPLNRRRSEESVLHGDGARRSMQAKVAMQAVQDMVNLRARTNAEDTRKRDPISRPVQLAENPFRRKSEKTVGSLPKFVPDAGLQPPAPKLTPARSKAVELRVPDDFVEPEDSDGDQIKCTFPLPPPTSKPLRPISAISVPSLPPSAAVTPQPKRKAVERQDPSRRRSTGSGQQATLPFQKKPRADCPTTPASRSTTSKAGTSSVKRNNTSPTTNRRTSTGAGFDWAGAGWTRCSK